MTDHDAIPTHVTEVVATRRLSDTFVRITFAGGLERFRPIGPDDFVHLLLPPPGRRGLTIDASFRWTDYEAMPEADRPVGAYYTVRRFCRTTGRLDCDVYLHDPAGPASRWAAHAAPGDPAALWGPRSAWHPPASATDWLLVTDETGLPAVAAILERRPPGLPVRVVAEVDTTAGLPALPCDPDVQLTRLHRDRRHAGTTTLLVDAVRQAPPSPATYVWGGAESRAVSAVRRHVRHEVGLAREQVSLTPYWRHASHAADPIDADD